MEEGKEVLGWGRQPQRNTAEKPFIASIEQYNFPVSMSISIFKIFQEIIINFK
jgi:hypothetical protein